MTTTCKLDLYLNLDELYDKYANLSYKIVNNPQHVGCVVNDFIKKINTVSKNILSHEKEAFIHPASSGTTGFTFICKLLPIVEDLNIKIKSTDLIDFILKLENKKLADNERFCAKVVEKLGFTTPTIAEVNKDSVNLHRLAKKLSELRCSISYTPSRDSIIFMPQFQATTFCSAVQQGHIYDFDMNDWNNLLMTFGRLAICDLLIGNDDRLVRLNLKSDHYMAENPNFNSGNIMLDISFDSKNQRTLKHIFVIDNTTSSTLMPKERSSQLDLVDDLITLFDSPVMPNAEEEYQEDTAEGEDLIEQPFKPSVSQFHEAFKYLTSEAHLDMLAQHILKGVIREITQDNKELPAYFENETAFNTILLGIKTQIHELRKLDIEGFITHISSYAEDEFSQLSLELIEMNLRSL